MIGIANPWGALGLGAVVALVLLLRLRRRTHVVPVGSLLLWRDVPTRAIERRRARPDRAFWLQLALLLALVAGLLRPWLARPHAGGGGTPLVVVVDCSASMQVREDDGVRFALARAEATRALDALPAGTDAMLVTATDVPRVAARWTADRGALAATLRALDALDVAAALAPAVELALAEARARGGARVLVLTDLPPERSGVDDATRAAVDWVAFGRRGDNVGITALDVDAPPLGALADASVTAVVRSFDRRPRGATLVATVGGRPWARRTLALRPHDEVPVLLTAPPAAGVVGVTLDGDDALAADDRAVAWLPPPRPLDLLAVTDADDVRAALLRLGDALPDAHVEVVNAAGWRERGGAVAASTVVLFDRMVPADEPAAPALYVAPPPGNPRCPAADAVDGAAVVDWTAGHPALGALDDLSALEVGRASRLLAPAWGTVLAQAASRRAAFPFLVVGVRGRHRIACLAAELPAPLATSDATPLLLVVLGTLGWLGTPPDAPLVVATGMPAVTDAPLAAGDGVRGSGRTVVAERIGERRLRTAAGGRRLVLASLLDADESSVGREGGGRWPARAPLPAAGDAPPRRPLAPWLEVAALALVAVEWVAWRRR